MAVKMDTDHFTPEETRNMQRGLTASGNLVQQPSDNHRRAAHTGFETLRFF